MAIEDVRACRLGSLRAGVASEDARACRLGGGAFGAALCASRRRGLGERSRLSALQPGPDKTQGPGGFSWSGGGIFFEITPATY